MKCSCGHTVEPGEFRCMVCGLDTTLIDPTMQTKPQVVHFGGMDYSVTTMKYHKPQLSAEMEIKERILDYGEYVIGYYDEKEHDGKNRRKFVEFIYCTIEPDIKSLLATALEEQKKQIYGEVLKIEVQDYLDDQGRNAIILRDDVLALLNGKEAQ